MSVCDSQSFTGYLRVSAIAIALYDGLWTIPAEISLYREQRSFKRMTRTCILFILIRYVSIIAIVVSNVGFFDFSFNERSCRRFYLIAPSLKAIQTMISQIIIARRTIAVAMEARWVIWTIGVLFVVSVALEFFSNIWARIPIQEPANSPHANCTSGNMGVKVVWVHYMAAMLYDATCLAIATFYIYRQSRSQPGHNLDELSKMLLKEGVLYFCFLTAVNVLNLVMYRTSSEQGQSAGATLAYAVTWIMSQRILIHLQEFKNGAHSRPQPVAQPRRTSKSMFPSFVMDAHTEDDVELGVHVTVEEAIKVDYDGDIAGRITTARIEKEHRHREERRKKQQAEDESFGDKNTMQGKGWAVTSAGKIFSP